MSEGPRFGSTNDYFFVQVQNELENSQAPDVDAGRPPQSDDGASDVEGGYVLLDEEGNPIPPEAEASCLMQMHLEAGGISQCIGLPPSGEKGADEELHLPSPSSYDTCGATITPINGDPLVGLPSRYTPSDMEDDRLDSDTTEMEIQRSAEFWANNETTINTLLAAFPDEEEGEQVLGATQTQPPAAADGPKAAQATVEEAEDDEEVGMEPTLSGLAGDGFTRTFSDQPGGDDDEWILEQILQRRKGKKHLNAVDDTDAYDEMDDEVSKGGSPLVSKKAFQLQYLCKWKWYADPTWESRAMLEDLGYIKEVTAFDHKRAEQSTHAPASRVDDEKDNPSDTDSAELLLVQKMFDDLQGEITKELGSSGFGVYSFTNVAKRAWIRRFLRFWKAHPKALPKIVYHGTRAGNIPSIVDRGLIVPGSHGVKVDNGKVHGVGIYTALTPHTPSYYTCHKKVMFACVGLCGADTGTKAPYDYRIFTKTNAVVPLYAVHFAAKEYWRYNRQARRSYRVKAVLDRPLPAEPEQWSMRQLSDHLAGVRSRFDVRPIAEQASGSAEAVIQVVQCPPSGRSEVDRAIPKEVLRKGVTKRMIKQAPRFLKEFYHKGQLKAKNTHN